MDLDLIPIQHGDEQLILIRDPLGLVPEGKALPMKLYEFLVLLDGTRGVRDLQTELMRQGGGTLVSSEEVEQVLRHLDESHLLLTKRYVEARERLIKDFADRRVRPCSHCGQAYPAEVDPLRRLLDEILEGAQSSPPPTQGRVVGLVAPHIDFSAGSGLYGAAYQCLRDESPRRVVILGVGHQLGGDCFSITEKDFQTPLGEVRNDCPAVQRLLAAGKGICAENDFVHKSEHSAEFQLLFLQHLLPPRSFSIVPVLCGSLTQMLPSYDRNTYRRMAEVFLEELANMIAEEDTLVVAGVDFSHIGPKFGHSMPAAYLEGQAERHDRSLLQAIAERDADAFWAESARVEDRFHVCGFAALACLMEVLPPARCHVLGYHMWHERPTRSAISFAAAVFTDA
jgi:hypothetical protein